MRRDVGGGVTPAEQLAAELGDRVHPIAAILPLDLAAPLVDTVGTAARQLADALTSLDTHEAAQAVIDVMAALWPVTDPPSRWWATPLGRVVAGNVDVDGSVTQYAAADMLGVTRSTVATLIDRGRLARHPDGGVDRASVLARLAGR